MPTVAFHTLGCKLNFSETSTIARQFKMAGWTSADYPAFAEVYVVNTCSVTQNADRECRQIVNRIGRINPEARVVIIGCYAQLKPDEIASIPGVDLVLGASEKFDVIRHLNALAENEGPQIKTCSIESLESFVPSWSLGDRTRAFLKVQDGCDYSCSFCTIPLARGASRSDHPDKIFEQVVHLAGSGVKEIVLTGINLGDYGLIAGVQKRQYRLIDLLQTLERYDGEMRFRLSSVEPNLLDEEIISFIASSTKFMPHFHIPLQSGSDAVLSQMRRRYRSELYRSRVETIVQYMPEACIGVDVICGFPTESEMDFQITEEFLRDLPVSYFHVFSYSERENTLAAGFSSQVPMELRKERTNRLRKLSARKLTNFYSAHLGSMREVLFESADEHGLICGYTDNYIRVQAGPGTVQEGERVFCKLIEINDSLRMIAEPVTVYTEA